MKGAAESIDHYLDTRNDLISFKSTTDKKLEQQITDNVHSLPDISSKAQDSQDIKTHLSNLSFNAQDSQDIRNNLISLRSKKEIIKNALEIARKKLSCQVAAIFLFSKDGLLERVGLQGVDKDGKPIEDDWFSGESYEVGKSFTGAAASPQRNDKYGKTQVTNDFGREDLENKNEYIEKLGELNCAIAVPLNGRNKTYGVLRIINKIDGNSNILSNSFSKEDLALVSFLGGCISAAISNFRRDTQNKILRYFKDSLIDSDQNNFDYSNLYKKNMDFLVGSETAFKAAILHIKNNNSNKMEVVYFATSDGLKENNNNKYRRLDQRFVELFSESIRTQIISKISKGGMIDRFIDTEWVKINNLESFGCFPLIISNSEEVVGTISLFAGYEYEFHPGTIELLTDMTSSMAVIIQKEKKREKINKKFEKLAGQWDDETGFMSSTTEAIIHPAYQQIIGMGEDVIPSLLEGLRTGSGRWFWALRAITGEDPVPEEQRGMTQKMIDAWIDWGRKKRYIN